MLILLIIIKLSRELVTLLIAILIRNVQTYQWKLYRIKFIVTDLSREVLNIQLQNYP